MIHVQRINPGDTGLFQGGDGFFDQLVTCLHINFTGFFVDNVLGHKTANQFVRGKEDFLQAAFHQFAAQSRGHLGPGLGHHFAVLGVD